MSAPAVVTILGGLIGITLHAVALTYIQKLERINCPCADHPYRNFLKYFMMVSIVVIAINMFMPLYNLAANPAIGMAVGAGLLLWALATVAFYVMAIIYVRYLVREKCACSEDVRREVLYIWSILELVILAIALFLSIFIGLASSIVGTALAKVSPKGIRSLQREVISNTTNPLKAVSKSAATLSQQFRRVKNKLTA